MKRLIVLGLVVVLVTVMSAPAALFAAGGGGGGGNGDCKDKRGGKCEYKKVKICHKPNTPAAKILLIPRSALSGHLGHGDFVISKDMPAKKCKKEKKGNNNGGHHGGGHHGGGHHGGGKK